MFSRLGTWSWRLAAVLLLAAWVGWLRPSLAPYAGSADVSGYLWSARLLRLGVLSVPIEAPRDFPIGTVGPDALAALGTSVVPGTTRLVPTYPTGLPLHLAAAQLALPEERAIRAVLGLAAALTCLLLYRLGREAGLGRPWALAGCGLLAGSPLFLFLAVQPLSDVLATLWAEAAVLLAWRSRGGLGRAWLAGAALGVAVLVRPSNLVLALPVLAALPATRRHLGRLVLGGLPFAVFLLGYQTLAYGHPLRAGYGDVSTAFSMTHLAPTLRHYAFWIPRLTSWLVLLAPLAWWAWRGAFARWRLVAGLWIGSVLGLYAFYVHTAETWWYLRFVLPAFPPLLVATLVACQDASRRWAARFPFRPTRHAVALASAVAIAASVVALSRRPEFDVHRGVRTDERLYRDALAWMAVDRLDDGPVLMGQLSGAANYYAPALRYVRFDRLSPGAWRALREWQRQAGAPIRAALFPFELEQLFPPGAPAFPCAWRPRGTYRRISFWECPP